MTGTGQTEFSPEMYLSQPRRPSTAWSGSRAGRRSTSASARKPVQDPAAQLHARPLRTVHDGTELTDLYRTIASGIGGANMPTWKGALKEDELWGLAYYVRSLVEMRDTPEAGKLAATLNDPANLSLEADRRRRPRRRLDRSRKS